MIINFPRALAYTLLDEGGNDDDPNDRGGRTSRGITQSEYDAWCHIHGQSTGDVWEASDATVQAIYHVNYWAPWCDRLPNAIDYFYFDMAVLHGSGEATTILQRALGNAANIDGHMGVITVADSMRAMADADKARQLIENLTEQHLHVYDLILDAHPSDEEFMDGWRNRAMHERANAFKMLETPNV